MENKTNIGLQNDGSAALVTCSPSLPCRVGEQSNPKVQEELRQRSEARNGGSAPRQSTPHGYENGGFLAEVESPAGPQQSARELHPTLAGIGRSSETGLRRLAVIDTGGCGRVNRGDA